MRTHQLYTYSLKYYQSRITFHKIIKNTVQRRLAREMPKTLKKTMLALAIITITVLSLLITGTLEFNTSEKDELLILEVNHSDSWKGTIRENDSNYTISGFGNHKRYLARLDPDEWVISIKIQKTGYDTNPLYIRLKLADGTVLKETSTIKPHGTAHLSITIP